MGIDLTLIKFFDACFEAGPLPGPVLALGSLAINDDPERVRAFAARNAYRRLAEEMSVSALFAERYGVHDYVSCDVNGLADFHIDLNAPLPPAHVARYGGVLNGGTLEHVFDVRQAFQNVHDALVVGGVAIHTTPTTWFDHGFFNFNPVAFRLLAEANCYRVLSEGFYYSAGGFAGQTSPIVSLLTDRAVPGQNFDNMEAFRSGSLPANAMHLVALKKTEDTSFKTPTQVST